MLFGELILSTNSARSACNWVQAIGLGCYLRLLGRIRLVLGSSNPEVALSVDFTSSLTGVLAFGV